MLKIDMQRSWFIAGTVLYAALCIIVIPFIFSIPWHTFFVSDDAAYSKGAIYLLQQGFYSIDGINAFMDREPGQSFFLAIVYALFGVENAVAVFLAQAVLFYGVCILFVRALGKVTNDQLAGVCFVLLLLCGSILHAIFSAYRELLTLMLLMGFAIVWIELARSRTYPWWMAALMGVLLGCAILTYYSLVFFPLFLLALWLFERRPLKSFLIFLCACVITVGLWGLRNYSYDGQLRVVDARRADIMWYVRGEQAVHVRGSEPLMCLWSEYVSRTWEGRSPYCSFNAVKNRLWVDGEPTPGDILEAGTAGRTMIKENFVSYVWFSIVEILEMHTPYVGGGWSRSFNVYVAVSHMILLLGVALGIRSLMDPRFRLFWLLASYHTAIFALTDASPRYLVPVLFCHAAIAAFGYSGPLSRLLGRATP